MIELYKRGNNGKPYRWSARLSDNLESIIVTYGYVNGLITANRIKVTQKNPANELQSLIDSKRSKGYLELIELKDDGDFNPSPVEESTMLLQYLDKYLPTNLTNTNTNAILPMLAKTYTGKYWNKYSLALGQPKINGLRCLITVVRNNDMFKPWSLRFQSREGNYWQSLSNLEDHLFTRLNDKILARMYDEDIALDGEIYLPGYTVNQIDSFVKNASCPENKLLQYWCYDIAIEDVIQIYRYDILHDLIRNVAYCLDHRSINLNNHLTNRNRLVYIRPWEIAYDDSAITIRDKFIGAGFEGLILRNPSVEYQFGRRRVAYMEKFKSATDGLFTIVAIDREVKRDVPLITCKNDVNDATFETSVRGSFEYQKSILDNKEKYIGMNMFIKFGERSGVNKVPFHITETKIEVL